MKNPLAAGTLRSRFMRNEQSYNTVFSDKIPIEIWPKLVTVQKYVEDVMLESQYKHGVSGERFLKSWRGLIAFLLISKISGTFDFSVNNILSIDAIDTYRPVIVECFNLVQRYRNLAIRQNMLMTKEICATYSETHNILGIEVVGLRKLSDSISTHSRRIRIRNVTPEFIDQVDSLLPMQPWAQGVHVEIAKKLGCKASKASMAINRLIDTGRRHNQADGVLFDRNWKVIDA